MYEIPFAQPGLKNSKFYEFISSVHGHPEISQFAKINFSFNIASKGSPKNQKCHQLLSFTSCFNTCMCGPFVSRVMTSLRKVVCHVNQEPSL